MLPCIVFALSSSPPPPTFSYEQVHSSSSFESTTSDPKVLDFFLGGEVIGLGLNLSFCVNNFVHIFNH